MRRTAQTDQAAYQSPYKQVSELGFELMLSDSKLLWYLASLLDLHSHFIELSYISFIEIFHNNEL